MPRGGRIAIDGAPGVGGFVLSIRATGETVKADDEALKSLSGDRDPATLEARGIAPYMAARLAAAVGASINAVSTAQSMEYSVILPTDSQPPRGDGDPCHRGGVLKPRQGTRLYSLLTRASHNPYALGATENSVVRGDAIVTGGPPWTSC